MEKGLGMSYKGRKTLPPVRDGETFDAFSKNWRRMLHWHSQQIKRVKRRFNKRARRESNDSIRKGGDV